MYIHAPAIIINAMNRIDPRLMNHGKRVAYLVWRVLRGRGYDDARLRDILLLVVVHDIGAYKTEEIDQMARFETKEVWGHSIYGYLFMKYFSPLDELARVLLYHHTDAVQADVLSAEQASLAKLMSLCDRADLLFSTNNEAAVLAEYFEQRRGGEFCGEAMDAFFAAGIARDDWAGMKDDADFARLLYDTPMSAEQAVAYVRMIIYSIDFRSPQTMLHTFALELVAVKLAELCGLAEEECERVAVAALVHDIGKMGTPLHILESPHRLLPEDFEIMKQHVAISEEILTGNMDAGVVAMAINHHEKMDGTGYMKGLEAGKLPLADRIMAAADVLSALWGGRSYKDAFPKEKVLGILANMRGGHLDAGVVDMAVAHYDEIAAAMAEHAVPVQEMYDKITREQEEICASIA